MITVVSHLSQTFDLSENGGNGCKVFDLRAGISNTEILKNICTLCTKKFDICDLEGLYCC